MKTTNLTNKQILDRVMDMLGGQKFHDWYNTGQYNDFVTGDLEYNEKITYQQAESLVRQRLACFLQLDTTTE